VTTIDATSGRSLAHVEIEQMTAHQASALVLDRLGLEPTDLDEAERVAVALLIAGTERWPLAIELSCAYLADSGRRLALTAELVTQLRNDVLDDDAYVPLGYPRSLVAAINIALRRIATLPHGEEGLLVARRCSLLASEAIPTAIVGPTTGGGGSAPDNSLAGQQQIALDKAVVALRRCSLLSRDPKRRAPHPILSDVLAMNTIVADVVRQHLESDESQLLTVVAELFETFSTWVGYWTDTHAFAALDAIRAHLERLLAFANERDIASPEALTIMGNLSMLYQKEGRHRDAIELLTSERKWLYSLLNTDLAINPYILLMKTNVALVAKTVVDANDT
jgi:hypothetical protein